MFRLRILPGEAGSVLQVGGYLTQRLQVWCCRFLFGKLDITTGLWYSPFGTPLSLVE